MEHKRVPTTPEVWAVIKASHPELKVFGSYSAPDGDSYGDPNKCVMMTEYGFDVCDYPIMGAKTTWDKNHEKPHERLNEKHEYWLCVGIICEDG